jgi:uncharacterized phage-like protein YoqJ
MIVSFTGHRPNKLGGFLLPNPTYIHVCQQLEKTLKELQPTEAISGMALGIDSWAANICIKLGIPFTAAIPFIGQEKAWPQASQKTYHALLNKAAKQVIVSEGGYTAAKMQIRNEWMVDRCDTLIAVFRQTETSGGTFNCIRYAQSIGKKIIFIDPTLEAIA